ncbi:MAG: class I SAM-dependent methyltransferase [Pseudomonadota bacterium]
MTADDATLGFYNREAETYAEYAAKEGRRSWLDQFMGKLRPGDHVLDFGSGPGWAAARLKEAGFTVDAIDGSEGLAAQAKALYGLTVTVAQFQDFSATDAYDGIWASFSLLHDERKAMPGHLGRLFKAMRPGGPLYVGLKEGEGMHRDDLGRRYTYYREAELTDLVATAGFAEIETSIVAATGFDGSPTNMLHLFARRPV